MAGMRGGNGKPNGNPGGDYDSVIHKDHTLKPDYQRENDHDLLIMVVERQDIMREGLRELKEAIAAIQCPSAMCHLHDRRLCDLETTADDYTSRKNGFWNRTNTTLTLIFAAVAIIISILAIIYT